MRTESENELVSVSALNDALALEHPIDAYYSDSPFFVRLIEQRRLALIERFVGPSDGLELLEVGSGGGHVLARFPKARRTALDVSRVYLDTARARLEGNGAHPTRFVQAEIGDAGFADESFDRVICTEVLEHCVEPDAVLAGIARVLRRRDGVAVITIPNDLLIQRMKTVVRRSPLGWALDRFGKRKIEWGGDRYHLHVWSAATFRALLERRFRVTDVASAPFDQAPVRLCFRCVRK